MSKRPAFSSRAGPLMEIDPPDHAATVSASIESVRSNRPWPSSPSIWSPSPPGTSSVMPEPTREPPRHAKSPVLTLPAPPRKPRSSSIREGAVSESTWTMAPNPSTTSAAPIAPARSAVPPVNSRRPEPSRIPD